jgi:hypothetical protein
MNAVHTAEAIGKQHSSLVKAQMSSAVDSSHPGSVLLTSGQCTVVLNAPAN